MARKYICDECGEEMNGNRAIPQGDRQSGTLSMELVPGKILYLRIERQNISIFRSSTPRDMDLCWACLGEKIKAFLSFVEAMASKDAGEEDANDTP